MATDKLELRTFNVTMNDWPAGKLADRTVTAAYFKDENGFVTFKDTANQAVYSVRVEALVAIERVEPQPQDSMSASAVEFELGRRYGWTPKQVSEVPEWMLAALLEPLA